MAIACPSCGMENADSATECRRCRASFAEAPPEDLSASLGVICERCEAYNEPGVARCTTCGYKLDEAPKAAAAPASEPTLSEELSALALSAEEAADAGLEANGAKAPPAEPAPAPPSGPPPGGLPRGWAAVEAAMGGSVTLRTPPTVPAIKAPEPHKTCQSCAAENPAAAKFCSECGSPFGKAPQPAARPAKTEPPPTVSVQMDEVGIEDAVSEEVPPAAEEPAAGDAPEAWASSTDPTARPYEAPPETSPINLQDPSPEPLGWEEPGGEAAAAEPVAEGADGGAAVLGDPPMEEEPAPAEEVAPPYQASLVVERGSATGTTYLLGHVENVVGTDGAAVELPDPHLAPRHAAIVFDEQRLLVRDEGAANGVYVKVRASAAIEPGDYFLAGERLLRFDGPCELPVGEPGETPYLGSPRPRGTVVRVTEILRGGKTGRTCFRAGPAIAVGRTGCDLNFASDAQLAPRHAEVRLAPDGSATLVDLEAAPSGVFLRLRPQQSLELQAGDVLQLGDQVLRLDVG